MGEDRAYLRMISKKLGVSENEFILLIPFFRRWIDVLSSEILTKLSEDHPLAKKKGKKGRKDCK